MKPFTRVIAGAGFVLASLLSTGVSAQTATAQGTQVDNIATVNFTVGGVAQTMCSSPTTNSTLLTSGTCATATTKTSFKVDSKIDVLVTAGTPQSVQPTGSAIQVTTFTVKNQGNVAEFLLLTPTGLGSSQSANGQTSTVSAAGYSCSVTSVGAGYTVNGSGIVVTSPGGAAVPAGASFTATVSCAVPTTPTSTTQWNATATDYGAVSLTATAVKASNDITPLTNVASGNLGTGNGSDGTGVVLADSNGTDDVAKDAKYSARNYFTVSAALVKVTKTVAILCDPTNQFTTPKFIPGAYVTYTITVQNTGNGSAILSSTSLTDVLQNSMTLDPNLITAGTCSPSGTSPGGANNAVKVVYTNTGFPTIQTSRAVPSYQTVATVSTVSSGTTTINVPQAFLPAATGTVNGNYLIGELKPNEQVVLTFNAIIP